ncbi:MAG: octaprenyl diphosphate synthase [Chromatiales bacterium]|nr:octaprenyl diphosphate synthase [Chromatiales bacterium]
MTIAGHDPANLEAIRSPVANDMLAVDRLIRSQLASDVVLINQIGEYIVGSGGKRLRPLVVVLSGRALGHQGTRHHELAAIIEFIHTATLLHDDVVDESSLRRGNETANAVWGNAASVLVGDFLYSRSFEMMAAIQNMRIMDIMSHTTNRIAEGEVLQLLNCHDANTDEARYLEVIHRKTATLFEAGCRIAAVVSDAGSDLEEAMSAYGLHMGTAFQLVDDVLDYSADPAELGKNVGDDLAEGKPTLPLIRALQQADSQQATMIRAAIEGEGAKHIDEIVKVIETTDAIPYTRRLAEVEAEKARSALEALPESPFKTSLIGLASFAVARSY